MNITSGTRGLGSIDLSNYHGYDVKRQRLLIMHFAGASVLTLQCRFGMSRHCGAYITREMVLS